jgi:hypothetical protein
MQPLHDGILSGWNLGALARGFAFDRRRTGCTAAAIFSEKAEQRVHLLEPCRVDHRTALATYTDKARRAEPIKVESQCVGCEIESISNGSRRHSLRTGLYKQPEYIEPIVLCERRQGGNSVCLFHISMIVEINFVVKIYFNIH